MLNRKLMGPDPNSVTAFVGASQDFLAKAGRDEENFADKEI